MATKKFSEYAVQGQNVTLTYDNINDTVTFDVVVDKTDVGLGNVDNTSDVNKPVSTATQTALNLKQNSLVSGTNIKTVNSNTLLGSGDLVIDKTSVGLGNVANVDTTNATNITSGTLADARLTANVTTQGNTFNTANKLVQLDGTAKLPAIDGSQLTNLPTPTTPTLATVTTAGNTTTNAISVGGLTVATSLIYTDLVNNRVGIGTTSPSQPFHIVGRTRIAHSTGTSLHIYNDGTTSLIDSLTNGNAAHDLRISAQNISFYSGSSYGTVYAKLFNTGNFALGSNPTDAGFKLDVNGTARVQATVGTGVYVAQISNPTNSGGQWGLNLIAGNSDNNRILHCQNIYGQTIFVVKGNRSININPPISTFNYATLFVGNAFGGLPTLLVKGNGTTSEITFQTQNSSGTALLTTLDNGNVGIGTATPINLLHIEKNQNSFTSIVLLNQDTNALSRTGLNISNGLHGLEIFQSRGYAVKIIGASEAGIYSTGVNIGIMTNGASSILKFAAGGSSTSQMTLFSNGNLGIGVGTTDAGYKLDVNGSTRLNGALTLGMTPISAISVASTHKLEITIAGTTYYLLATNI